ncbi:MAG: phosphoribosyltransferase family protein [Chloroflexota bacterium]
MSGTRHDRAVRSLLDLLLPPTCPGCGREGDVLCPGCRAWLDRRRDEPPGVPLGLAAPLPAHLDQVEWCAAFSGPVRAAIHAHKYRGERRLAVPLGSALAERWGRAGAGGDLVCHVPVHASRLKDRGFDQARDLADVAGRRLGLRALPVLERAERTRAMHALGRAERARNVGHAFRVRPGMERAVAGRHVVLVDDVLTTGATASGCAAALLAAGAARVAVLAVARER